MKNKFDIGDSVKIAKNLYYPFDIFKSSKISGKGFVLKINETSSTDISGKIHKKLTYCETTFSTSLFSKFIIDYGHINHCRVVLTEKTNKKLYEQT